MLINDPATPILTSASVALNNALGGVLRQEAAHQIAAQVLREAILYITQDNLEDVRFALGRTKKR
jgi:hypothetical protein